MSSQKQKTEVATTPRLNALSTPSDNQKLPSVSKFDYAALDSQRRNDIEQATEAIRERLRRAAKNIWEIGKMLCEVQSKLERGQFDEWIKSEFDWSRRTAYKFISVYKRFDQRINLEQINIATSALYLLAAESTPEEIRAEFIQKAQQGEKITHQQVKKVVNEAKNLAKNQLSSSSSQVSPENSQTSDSETLKPKQQLITVIPPREIEQLIDSPIVVPHPQHSQIEIKPGWYQVDQQHYLFCGDTALPEFFNRVPYSTLAIAITEEDWAHDWLIEKAKTVVVFPESEFDRQKLTGLLVMFSAAEDSVIFPWLPNDELIVITHQLDRKVYAGDIDPQKCQAAAAKTGLSLTLNI